LPSCGVRNYRLVAQTRPTVNNGLPDVRPRTEGLADASIIAIQFIGASPYVAMDLQLREANGSVESFKGTASLDIPAVYGFPINPNQRFDLSLDNTPLATDPNLKRQVVAQAMLAGEGGRKIVLYLKPRIGLPSAPAATDQFVAVFEATDPGVLPGTCVTPSTDPGTPIVPVPTSGTYWVFGATNKIVSLFRDVASDVTFTARGALATADNGIAFAIPETTPTYDLAGNSYAFIGRVNGPVSQYGTTVTDALAYGVAKRPTNPLPATGQRRYTLVSATAPVASIGPNGVTTILGTGTLNTATIDVLFAQNPYGVVNSVYGGVIGSIQGSVAGKDFTLTNAVNVNSVPDVGFYHIDEAWFQVGFVSSSNTTINIVEGALAGPNGQYLVIHYTTTSGVMSIDGTALLRQQ
jgi:hypothetical protein